MKFLLDTHLLLWIAGQPDRLPNAVHAALLEASHEFLFSAASIWEIVIKATLGRADFQIDPGLLRSGLLTNGYRELTITSQHVLAVRTLPPLHKDPFDRMLVAQAQVENATLLTSDPAVAKYPGPIRQV